MGVKLSQIAAASTNISTADSVVGLQSSAVDVRFSRAQIAGGLVGGTSGQIQYNNSGSFGGYTGTQVTALLDTFTTLKGLTPASSGGTTNFLRADGTWNVPVATATAGGNDRSVQFNSSGTIAGSSVFIFDIFNELIVGNNSVVNFAGLGSVIQSINTGSAPPFGGSWHHSLIGYGNNANGANIGIAKTRGTVPSSQVILQANDSIGGLWFYASDGLQFQPAARISAFVGTVGSSVVPGGLSFYTTPDDSATLAERMRFTSRNLSSVIAADYSGIVLVGRSTTGDLALTGASCGTGVTALFQINTKVDTSYEPLPLSLIAFGNSTHSGLNEYGSIMQFVRTRSSNPLEMNSTDARLTYRDGIGEIEFIGADGNGGHLGANIRAVFDSTGFASPGICPMRLEFWTGIATARSHLAINAQGSVILQTEPVDQIPAVAVGVQANYPELQVLDQGGTLNGINCHRYANFDVNPGYSDGAQFIFSRTNSNDPALFAALTSSQELAEILFIGTDGNFYQETARINVFVDGTVVSSVCVPGRFDFYTQSSRTGSSGLATHRVRLDSSGWFNIGRNNSSTVLTAYMGVGATVVSLLPPSSTHIGARATVLDSTVSSTGWSTLIQGGGANVTPVYSDGSTAWRIG